MSDLDDALLTPGERAHIDQYRAFCREAWETLPHEKMRDVVRNAASKVIARFESDDSPNVAVWRTVAASDASLLRTEERLRAEAGEADPTDVQAMTEIYLHGMMAFCVYEYLNTGELP
jgi:hypothetical protein